MRFLLLVLTLLPVFTLFGQFSPPESSVTSDCLNRILLIELQGDETEVVDKLRNSGFLNEYKRRNNHYNENIQTVVRNHWIFHDSIQFVPTWQIDLLLKKEPTKYAVLKSDWKHLTARTQSSIKTFYGFQFGLYVVEPNQSLSKVFTVSLPSDRIDQSDYLFVIYQFNQYLNNAGSAPESFFDFKSNQKTLKSKKLMIPRSSVNFPISKIKDAYKHPFVYTENVDISMAVQQGDSTFLYITQVWSDLDDGFCYVAVDMEDLKILSVFREREIVYPVDALPADPRFEKRPFRYGTYRSLIVLTKAHFDMIDSKDALEGFLVN